MQWEGRGSDKPGQASRLRRAARLTRVRASTFCIAVGLQATAQILSERLWREKVALVRFQTHGCAVWGDEMLCDGSEGEAERGQVVASERDEEWDEGELDLVASTSGSFAKSVRPLLSAIVQQMVYVHCPRASFAQPCLLHPIRVVATRLCCPGWCKLSHWECLEVTLKGAGGTSCSAGIIPWAISHVAGMFFRTLRIETRCLLPRPAGPVTQTSHTTPRPATSSRS